MQPPDIKERLACLLVAETVITVLAMLLTAWLATICLTTDTGTTEAYAVAAIGLFVCAIALIMLIWHLAVTVRNLIQVEKLGGFWLITSLSTLSYLAWETALSPICFLRKHFCDTEDAIKTYLRKEDDYGEKGGPSHA